MITWGLLKQILASPEFLIRGLRSTICISSMFLGGSDAAGLKTTVLGHTIKEILLPYFKCHNPQGSKAQQAVWLEFHLQQPDPLEEGVMKPATDVGSQPTRKAPLSCAFLQHYPDGSVTLAMLHQWPRYLGPLPGRGLVAFTSLFSHRLLCALGQLCYILVNPSQSTVHSSVF